MGERFAQHSSDGDGRTSGRPHRSDRAARAGDPDATLGDGGTRRRKHSQKASLLRRLHPEGIEWGANIEDFDPAVVDQVRRWLGAVFGDKRWFRLTVQGWQHIPQAPTMIVSNHSGGTLIPDIWGLVFAWYGHFGTARPIHPAAHEMVLGNRVTGPFFSRCGVVRADRRVAARVLSSWREDLLVMPGGDLDTWRPYKARYQVRFAGRTGYARLALRTGVPVVPLANAGAHETLMVLTDGHRIAEKLRLPQLVRAHIFPIHLSLPWGLAVGPWPHVPLPIRLRYRFGRPIDPREVGAVPGAEPTDAQVAAFDTKVRAGVQTQLDALREERPRLSRFIRGR